MNRHLGVLLDWTMVDFAFLGIAIQQYISISRDLKRTREKANAQDSSSFSVEKESKRLL